MEDIKTTQSEVTPDVASGVWMMTDIFVNLYFVQDQDSDRWVLVDTGTALASSRIRKMAGKLFGKDTRPEAIILTHGHFDHAGSVKELAAAWDVNVYAHPMEMPYLTGRSAYPPAEPAVGGGLIAWLSGLYPLTPIDIHQYVRPLPQDGKVPGLKGWKWLHTPGHAPGHVSLFRESDGLLIAGDALATTKAESAFATLSHQEHLSGPPAFVVYDWGAAEKSVRKLSELGPQTIASGHGPVMQGEGVAQKLGQLADDFQRMSVPPQGRYKNRPAVVGSGGVVSVPPKTESPYPAALKIAGLVSVAGLALLAYGKWKK
jgi:glyoxylase-like metal-dependent hydrolase (beta-lactamase superfamily II)